MKKSLILTNEFPPNVYGGAGVHVDYLTRELARLIDVEVRCFGDQRRPAGAGGPAVEGFAAARATFEGVDSRLRKALEPVLVDLHMIGKPTDADLVHCHTWYTLLAGVWIKEMYGIPLVATTHSLEPLRPWKAEQLGAGYRLSSWIERTALEAADAVIAVSANSREEVLEWYGLPAARVSVIHNGIDVGTYRPVDPSPALRKHGIAPERPYLLFVGRLTRQKGVMHLVRALHAVEPGVQAVLCAGAPDTPEIEAEMAAAVGRLQEVREGVFWIRKMVAVPELVELYSGAALFVCPSIYEPFGIINLEAMACRCPVVASRVGGIPEVVVDGETGLLVPLEAKAPPDFEPRDPGAFEAALAAAINRLASDPAARETMGEAGRRRVEASFSWTSIARQTRDLYERLCADRAAADGNSST